MKDIIVRINFYEVQDEDAERIKEAIKRCPITVLTNLLTWPLSDRPWNGADKEVSVITAR